MDDQQGNVIDGTERARQWRGSKSNTRSTPDDAEARSDAPKSFAGSLLVPADMLPAALPPGEPVNGNAQGRAATPTADATAAGTGDRPSAASGVHQNPFLVSEAARVEHRPRSARRPMIAALLANLRGLISTRRRSSRPPRDFVAMLRRLVGPRLTRLLALAALTGAVVVTAVIALRPDAANPASESALRAAGPLKTRERSLSAASNPFARLAVARHRPSHRVRRMQAHRTIAAHRQRRPASKPAVVPAQYTPPASDAGSPAPAPANTSSVSSAPPAGSSQPAPSGAGGTTSGSSTSSSTRPAFGQNGTLGPGHSPSS